jgi:hypothetical protein
MSNQDVIIFCQAPADISYVLTLYEKYKKDKFISIYVINVENVYKFIKNLNLDLKKLVFIPYVLTSFKNLLQVFKERKRIKFLKKQNFDFIKCADVYFFSRFEDWLTPAFLINLESDNTIYYVDHYDYSGELYKRKKPSFKLLAIKLVYYILTNVNFKLEIIEKSPEFQYSKYKIKRLTPELDNNIFEKYSHKIKVQNTRLIALFFISPCENIIYDCEDYDVMQTNIIKSLKKYNWNVVVKGHPRLGTPNNIIDLVDMIIPSFIPAEFVKIENVSICLGITTTSLGHFAKNTDIITYSLLNLFKFNNEYEREVFKKYLSELSNNKIRYFNNYLDFENKIKFNVI